MNQGGNIDKAVTNFAKIYVMIAISAVILIIYVLLKNVTGNSGKYWQCVVTSKHTDPEYPNLKITTGTFQFYDKTDEEIKDFAKSNTFTDSLVTQTCKCRKITGKSP